MVYSNANLTGTKRVILESSAKNNRFRSCGIWWLHLFAWQQETTNTRRNGLVVNSAKVRNARTTYLNVEIDDCITAVIA